MTTKKGSNKKATSTKTVGAKKAVKTAAMVVMVPATSSGSAYNYYANNAEARSAAVARFYGSSKPSRRKTAK